jgi:MHS family proline/betaine transporter-like MFS transporter
MKLQHKNRIILAAMMGNLVETFDFAICGLLTLYLAKHLHTDVPEGLMLVLLSFFAGHLARPFGAICMGAFSDIYGRKIMMAASVFFMGIATAAIGIIPSYSHAGNLALFLLFPLRIVQSFACGAEYLNSSAFLVECSAKNRRGFSASWSSFGGTAGVILATFATIAVVYFSEKYPELETIIWRAPFILALLGSSVGVYVRLRMPESLEYVLYYSEHTRPNFKKIKQQSYKHIKQHKLNAVLVVALSALGVATSYLFYVYGPLQAQLYNHMSQIHILSSNLVALSVMLITYPIVGKLADTYDRTTLLRLSSFALLVLSPYFFEALSGYSLSYLMFMHVCVSIATATFCAVVPVVLAELFPLQLRCTLLSALFALGASIAAGASPLVAYNLVEQTHNTRSPSLIVTFLVLFVWGVLLLMQKRDAEKIVYT